MNIPELKKSLLSTFIEMHLLVRVYKYFRPHSLTLPFICVLFSEDKIFLAALIVDSPYYKIINIHGTGWRMASGTWGSFIRERL